MTFEDVEDVNLAADFYMFSSQVDGEQDLLEEASPIVVKKPTPPPALQLLHGISSTTGMVNGTTSYTLGSFIKTEPPTGNNSSRPLLSNGVPAGGQQFSLGLPLSTSAASEADNEIFFSCDMCNAKLKNKRNFETHMKRHRGMLPFKCDECPKTFQGRRDLDTHKRSRHDPSKRNRMELDLSLVVSKAESSVCPPSPFVFSSAAMPKTIGISMNGLPEGIMSGGTVSKPNFRNCIALSLQLFSDLSFFLKESLEEEIFV
jgi:hypothetical protein